MGYPFERVTYQLEVDRRHHQNSQAGGGGSREAYTHVYMTNGGSYTVCWYVVYGGEAYAEDERWRGGTSMASVLTS